LGIPRAFFQQEERFLEMLHQNHAVKVVEKSKNFLKRITRASAIVYDAIHEAREMEAKALLSQYRD
jgi:hypothetical protein